MADWLRLWHGTVTDTKFLWVARRSGARFGDVVAACVPCNRSKGAMTLEQWRARK